MEWILANIPENELDKIFPDLNRHQLSMIIVHHDMSKLTEDEYDDYDNYFYRGGYSTKVGKEAFDRAWLHHIHVNPHHWQHWVLISDEGNFDINIGKVKALDMPNNYIFEMICDWWSFNWAKHASDIELDGDSRYEIFNWYDSHKDKMILSELTRKKVEELLGLLRKHLDIFVQEEQELLNAIESFG